tara:strand:+ start:1141 stop:1494 length:354 start_codon:yes stop_codon:yes gene_type:complete
MISKKNLKNKRSLRIRSKLKKITNLRLCAFRSSKHIYIQVIDDKKGETLLSASSHDDSLKINKGKPKEVAFKVGEKIGDLIIEKKISDKFTFDRGGYLYHGRIKELAMGIRSKGIKF